MKRIEPIHTAAYDPIAQAYQRYADSNAYNAYCERPTTLSVMPDVRGKAVLDAACGPGFYAEWCVQHGATVTAVDGSPQMVQLVRERLGQAVAVHVADLGQPLGCLGTEAFDLVVCALALDYVADLGAVFAEFLRVLRPSGWLVLSIEHPQAVFLRSGRRYFDTEVIPHESSVFEVVLQSYRRPLQAYFDALRVAGFMIDRLKEAVPTDACKREYPEVYERLSTRPSFLCIRALKP